MEDINDDLEYQLKVAALAKIGHQANKAWCEVNGDFTQLDWEDAPDWQRNSMIAGTHYVLANPDAPLDGQHNAWMADKIKDGWVYGPEKDAEKKTHHCLVPYEQLPEVQRKKDILFRAIVNALK